MLLLCGCYDFFRDARAVGALSVSLSHAYMCIKSFARTHTCPHLFGLVWLRGKKTHTHTRAYI